MGHNSMVSDHPKSTRIPRVYELSTGPPDLGCHSPCPFPKVRGRNAMEDMEGDSLRVCKSKRRREFVKGKEDEDEDEVWKKIGYFKKIYKYRFKTKVKSKLVCLSQAHIYISNVAVSSSLINSFEFESTIEYVGEMVRVFFSLINGFKFEPTIEYVGEMVMGLF